MPAFPNSAPVLPSADTGGNYHEHPLSTGPCKFASYTPGHCREAAEYAADKTAILTAWGGATTGQLASTVMPPRPPR